MVGCESDFLFRVVITVVVFSLVFVELETDTLSFAFGGVVVGQHHADVPAGRSRPPPL